MNNAVEFTDRNGNRCIIHLRNIATVVLLQSGAIWVTIIGQENAVSVEPRNPTKVFEQILEALNG